MANPLIEDVDQKMLTDEFKIIMDQIIFYHMFRHTISELEQHKYFRRV